MGNNKNCFPISLSDPQILPVEKRRGYRGWFSIAARRTGVFSCSLTRVFRCREGQSLTDSRCQQSRRAGATGSRAKGSRAKGRAEAKDGQSRSEGRAEKKAGQSREGQPTNSPATEDRGRGFRAENRVRENWGI
ncbi:Uncharacterized protein Adt_08168 [Abeliophyllum distichum]|uniref:Uncharacterized protein n=1 Tax=Abeliophyllum distichum TaxID=126358 RepID=A0ABD1VC64_9LAMI